MTVETTTPLAHLELWELARNEIRQLIVSGELAPGERLVEATLSERFNVSRGPVRTALKELERTGLVVVSPRRGTHVASFGRQDVEELYDVTLALERVAVRKVAVRITADEVRLLEDQRELLAVAEAAGEFDSAVSADLELHRQIMELSGSRRLAHLWGQLAEEMRVVIAISQRDLPDVPWAQRNQPIVQALSAGDADRAEAEVVAYFERARRELEEHYGPQPPSDATT